MTLSPRHHRMLRAYAEITGTAIEACVAEALEDWLAACATSRLESLARKSASA